MGAIGACCNVKPFVLVTQLELEEHFPDVLCDPEFPNDSPAGPGAWFDLYGWLLTLGWSDAFAVKKRTASTSCNIEIWGVSDGPCDNSAPFPCLSENQSGPYPGTDFTTRLPGCCPEPVSNCVDEVGVGIDVDEWQCGELHGDFVEGGVCDNDPCPDPCDDCQWATEDEQSGDFTSPENIFYSWYYTWKPVGGFEGLCQAQWNPGYPAGLDGTKWIIAKESWQASAFDINQGQATGGESNQFQYKVWQCKDGKAVDITSEAVTFPDLPPADTPVGPGTGPILNCGDYGYCFNWTTGETTGESAGSCVPAVADSLPEPKTAEEVLICPEEDNPLP